ARAESGPAQLSFAQQRLWMLDQIEPGGTAYVISGALELRGALDARALERAFEAIVNRHDSLRTVFVNVDGEPRQVVSEPGPWALAVEDLGGEGNARERLDERLRTQAARGFDLARGPLFRARLYRLAMDRHVLLLNMHHIVSDGWSLGVLTRELGEFYRSFVRGEAPGLPALRIQYRDFARWQRGWLQGEVLASQISYWRESLAGAPRVLELPTDRPRPAVESHRGASHAFTLPRELADQLQALSRREGSSLFMTLLSGFALLLSRYSGQRDLLIGTPVANRNRAEIEPLIGFFVNTLVLRADLSGEPSVRAFLARMREVCLDAFAHQDLPFDRLVEELHPERDMSRNPVFQVMFGLQNAPMDPLELPGLTFEPVNAAAGAAQFDISLMAWETPEGLAAAFTYATDLFDAATIARMGVHWGALLEAMVAAPERRVQELAMLTGAERRQLLVEWNDTKTDYPRESCVQELFEAQAARTPDAVAVAYRNQRLTYRELSARSSQLAHFLRERGVGPDTLVPICFERSPEMVIGVLGILKAGGAYVPLDPGYPADRLDFMLEDTQASILLTQSHLAPNLPGHGTTAMCLDTEWHELERFAPKSPPSRTNATHLAYVIYTSGSTGRPKGVCVTHRGLVNYVCYATAAYEVSEGAGAPVHSSIAFDLTVTSLFAPLLAGRTVHLLPDDLGVEALVNAFQDAAGEYSLVKITPAHLQVLQLALSAEQAAKRTRVFVIGGEQLEAEAIEFWRRHAGNTVLVNEYGPTETTVGCCTYSVTAESRVSGAIPIGRPIANTQLYILDDCMEPVPIGVIGELYIGGEGVARGYLRRPDLTAEKFVADRFSGVPQARLYRTGDLVRYLPDGNIEFIGRCDNQVKLRGYRIELGEIETVLYQHPAIREVVVLAREDVAGDKRLVAYLVAREAAPSAAELKEHLMRTLPQHMVPSAFVFLQEMSLTPNGKVDRKALPAPERLLGAEAIYVAPRTSTEEIVAGIWAEVLKLERVGVEDNFFELGGHSLLAVRVIERMRRAGLHAQVRTLFMAATVAELAAAAGGESGVVEVPPNRIAPGCEVIVPDMLPLVQLAPGDIERIVEEVPGGAANVQDIYPLAPLQEGILFHHLMAGEGDPYLLHFLVGFGKRAQLDGYLRALRSVIGRHDILRTAVLWEGLPEPVQVVWREAPLVVEEISLDGAGGDVAEQLRARFDPRRYRLDVRKAPLLRVFIAHDAARARWVMLLLCHHLTVDHTTAEVMQQEIQAHLLGRAGELPAPLPFRNFVAQARLGI
ncbi:MAG TPA: amino acid adenylation domain-containing protein, partial [Pseudomonadales bacterium]|nr:amino acid adenylation domain-containing protein [Pseudomonadales bacterium]